MGINGSLEILADGVDNNSMVVTQGNNSLYYYCVVATNDLGSTLSNIIVIEMLITPSGSTDTGTTDTWNNDFSEKLKEFFSLFKQWNFKNPLIYIFIAAMIYALYKALSPSNKRKK